VALAVQEDLVAAVEVETAAATLVAVAETTASNLTF